MLVLLGLVSGWPHQNEILKCYKNTHNTLNVAFVHQPLLTFGSESSHNPSFIQSVSQSVTQTNMQVLPHQIRCRFLHASSGASNDDESERGKRTKQETPSHCVRLCHWIAAVVSDWLSDRTGPTTRESFCWNWVINFSPNLERSHTTTEWDESSDHLKPELNPHRSWRIFVKPTWLRLSLAQAEKRFSFVQQT